MGELAALIQAGDASISDFGRNPLWASVLVEVAKDKGKLDECCEVSPSTSSLYRSAPVYKSNHGQRAFAYMHPATALRWNQIGERLLPFFNTVAKRFSGSCFSNIRQNKPSQISRKGLFVISWSKFVDAHEPLLAKGPCMGVLDLHNFFPTVTPEIVQELLPRHVSDSTLVDAIAEFVADLGCGLPQGSATSQMVAQLLLATIDGEMERYGFLYARYVDDMRLAGASRLDVARDLMFAREIVEAAGFSINADKDYCHSARRSRCIPSLGGCPHLVNIEDYENDEEGFPSEPITYEGPYGPWLPVSRKGEPAALACREAFDSERLFEDHVCPPNPMKSEAVEKYTVRNLAKGHHPLLEQHAYDLASKRFGLERLYAASIRPETSLAVGVECLRGSKGGEPAHQHRAFRYLRAALSDSECSGGALQELTSLFEGGLPPHLELEFCAIAKEQAHRYAAVLPLVRKGIDDCWPDLAVARIGALSSVEKAERNRLLAVAEKVSPAAKVACTLIKAGNC